AAATWGTPRHHVRPRLVRPPALLAPAVRRARLGGAGRAVGRVDRAVRRPGPVGVAARTPGALNRRARGAVDRDRVAPRGRPVRWVLVGPARIRAGRLADPQARIDHGCLGTLVPRGVRVRPPAARAQT